MAAPPPAKVSPLLNPNVPLSGQALYQAAQALAKAQTQGPLTELARQIAQNNAQGAAAQKATAGYFQSLGNQVNQGNQQEQQIAGGLNTQLQGIANDTNTRLGQIGSNATQSLLRYAPQGEGGLAAPALQSLSQEVARQQGFAAQNEGAFRSFGATQGANYRGMGASQLGAFGLRGQEDLSRIGQATRLAATPLESKIAGLRATQGALFSTDLGKLRQQEVNNQLASAGLGLRQTALSQAAAQDNARNQLTLRGQNITQANDQASQELRARGLGITQQNNLANQAIRQSALNLRAAQGRGAPGTARPLTTHENNAVLTQLDKVQNAIRVWQQQGMKNSKGQVTEAHPTDAQMRQVLGSVYPSYLIQAAFELLGWGHITPPTASAMHQAGVRGGTFRGTPIRVAPAPKPTPTSGVAGGVGGAVGGASGAVGGVFGKVLGAL